MVSTAFGNLGYKPSVSATLNQRATGIVKTCNTRLVSQGPDL